MMPIFLDGLYGPWWVHLLGFLVTLAAVWVVPQLLPMRGDERTAITGFFTFIALIVWPMAWMFAVVGGTVMLLGSLVMGDFHIPAPIADRVEARRKLRDRLRKEEEAEERKQAEMRRRIEREIKAATGYDKVMKELQ